MKDELRQDQQRDRPWRWVGLTLGVLTSVVDIGLAWLLGITFEVSGRDATAWVWVYLAGSFGGLGYLVGWLVESRRRERAATHTAERRLEAVQELQGRLAELEKLAALGQLAATIAHEVRNPLAIIRSSVQNLSEDLAESDPAAAGEQGFLLEEIDRLNRVVTTILDYARPLRPALAEVDSEQLLGRVELLARGLLQPKSLRLSREGAAIALTVDLDLICQALLGLLGNGIEAAPEGSTIALGVAQQEGRIELSVADQGPGVDPAQREAIFEPFFTTKSSGSGLGLAVARRIAEAHRGSLVVDPAHAGGARFVMALPQGPEPRQEVRP